MSQVIAGIRAPDTRLVKEATELVCEHSSPMMFNHVMRSYYFSELLCRDGNLKYDPELLYLGTVMHDLGLTKKFDGPDRFEVEGANVARAFLTERGLADDKAWLIWDAIALHASYHFTKHKQDDVRAVQRGISADVGGTGLKYIEKRDIDEVVRAYPRLDFKKQFFDVMLDQAQRKPHTCMGHVVCQVALHHIPNYQSPDPRDMIEAAPFDE